MQSDSKWKDRWTLVAGGSRGLGLAIALRLAASGAKVALVARDPAQLDHASKALILAGSPETRIFAIDLAQTLDDHAKPLIDFCALNDIAMCVAAIGKSDRGYLTDLSINELHDAFAVNVISALQISQLVKDSLSRGSGRLVHIGSIAGIAAADGLGSYCMSKSALVAMSRQMRQEFRRSNITVTLVCTGPIARVDAGSRYIELSKQKGISARTAAPGGGVKLKLLDPQQLADQILQAAASRRAELIVPYKVRILAAIAALFPAWADKLIRSSMRR